ncbi:MAG TPA: PAN domain-containing protein [Bryobacteraceae bacterium]|jgi:hypothetical protein
MARKSIDLGPDRTTWSFGQLIYWHFIVRGTRPEIPPDAVVGSPWDPKEAAHALGVSVKTLWNWADDDPPPYDTIAAERVLFGASDGFDAERQELRDSHSRTRARKEVAKKAASGATVIPISGPQDEAPPISAVSEAVEPGHAPPPENSDTGLGQTASSPEPPSSQATSDTRQPEHARVEDAEAAPPPPRMPAVVPSRPLPRWVMPGFWAALIAVSVGYWWSQRPSERPQSDTPAVAENRPPVEPPPKKTAPQKSERRAEPPKQPLPPVQPRQQAEAPDKPDIPAAPPPAPPLKEPVQPQIAQPQSEPPAPSPEEEARIKSRQEAFDREQKEKEEQAVLLDRLDGDPEAVQREHDAEARQLAGLGYRLRENTAPSVAPFATELKASVAECARFCEARNCDGFSFYRNQYGPGSHRPRYCYLFRKPFTPDNNAGYVYGERVDDPIAGKTPVRKGALPNDSHVVLAQATPPPSDGIVRCSGGPVKVSGFKISCDTILGGGTSPRTPQERFMVRNINECAAKCRPVGTCTGFTFNSGDPEGEHACQLFGGRPEARESLGWVSGQR